MPHDQKRYDARGHVLAVGDRVILVGHITSLCRTSDPGEDMDIEIMPEHRPHRSYRAVNSGQVIRVTGDEVEIGPPPAPGGPSDPGGGG